MSFWLLSIIKIIGASAGMLKEYCAGRYDDIGARLPVDTPASIIATIDAFSTSFELIRKSAVEPQRMPEIKDKAVNTAPHVKTESP